MGKAGMQSKVILRTWDDTEAELIRGLLESYGIPCSVISDITHSVLPLTLNGLGEIRLSVPEEAAEEAERILQEHRADGPMGAIRAEALSEAERDD
jgi:hypothetical protein